MRAALLTATAGIGLANSPAALAQTAQAAQAQEGGIGDIIVTARKRQETTQDVPVSVVAISAERMQQYDLSNLERVAAQTPSFSIGRTPSGSGATLVLRGIGSNTTSIGLEQSVAVIVDGAYYGQGRTINEGFFDLARLEILKGPQALFFGKNATAGVVSITTADPGDKLEIIARGGYEFAAKQVYGEAIVSSPISDTLGIRIAARAAKQFDGYYRQLGTEQPYPTIDRTSTAVPGVTTAHTSGPAGDGRAKEAYIRGTLKWQPTDTLTAVLKANYGINENNNPSAGSVVYYCPTGALASNPAIACGKRFASSANRTPTDIAASLPYSNADGQQGNQYKSWAVNLGLTWAMDDLTISSVTNYNWNRNTFQFDADSVSRAGAPGVFATEDSTWHAFSQEVRAQTTIGGLWDAMIGGYYQSTKRDYNAWTASGGLENSAATPGFRRYLANSKDSQTNGQTFAMFGQLIVRPIDKVEITGGARYTSESKDSYFLQPYSHPIRVAQGIFLPEVTLRSNQNFEDWSPEATVTYKPTNDITIYGAYKTAYKSGGFSNSGIYSPSAGLADFEFDPEKAKGFEVGIKTTWLDRQLRLNLTAYNYKYSNLQLDFFRSDIFAFTTINAGSARTKGIEFEFQVAPRALDGFDLHGSVNYNRARYGDAPGSPCWAGQTRNQGCNLVYVATTDSSRPFNPATDTIANRQNLSGQPTANAPDWTGNLGASYEAHFGSGAKAAFGLDARYSGSYIATAFGNPYTWQKRYVSLDGSISLTTADEHWQFQLIGKNLTNRFYVIGGNDTPNSGSGTGTNAGVVADQTGYASLPRTVQAQVTFRY
ncbi:ligand-gated channel [Sphingomonas populi]|uniref:Ligand-gated channel n=1 Tax=Sphingomonas populi TaxID=2484750 RepID=A0A4Q6Y768_9SPHN|nr:TonB-dependent receptor [Sphingomonas populi]RZF65106.1 ligand-gated channel [Sphingomonas populi]